MKLKIKEFILKRWKWIVCLLFILGVVYKCGINHEYNELMEAALEAKKAHPKITVFDGDIEPPMPDLYENNLTVYGIDSNKNGLRDDVEIWINRTYSDPNIRMAMKQEHKVFQKIMLIKKGDSEASNKFHQDENLFRNCTRSFYENYEIYLREDSKLITLQYNVRSRKLQYNISKDNVTIPIGGKVFDRAENQKIYCMFKLIKD